MSIYFGSYQSGTGTQTLTQSSRFDNTNTFYTHTVTPGAVSLTQSSRFDNSNTFYTHALTATYTVTQSSRFDNSNSFYTHVLTTGAVTLAQSSRFDNSNTFYNHAVSAGAVTLSQSSRFDNTNTFYNHAISQGGSTQTLTQSARFDNSNTFYNHNISVISLTNEVSGWFYYFGFNQQADKNKRITEKKKKARLSDSESNKIKEKIVEIVTREGDKVLEPQYKINYIDQITTDSSIKKSKNVVNYAQTLLAYVIDSFKRYKEQEQQNAINGAIALQEQRIAQIEADLLAKEAERAAELDEIMLLLNIIEA